MRFEVLEEGQPRFHTHDYDEAVAEAESLGGDVRVEIEELAFKVVWPQNESSMSVEEMREKSAHPEWRVREVQATVVDVPPGDYFLGDPCYAVPRKQWRPLIEQSRSNGYQQTVGTIGAETVIGFGAGGDGGVGDQHGHAYMVDSGTIGLTPIAVATEATLEKLTRLGRIVSFDEPTTAAALGKVLIFGPYRIEIGW